MTIKKLLPCLSLFVLGLGACDQKKDTTNTTDTAEASGEPGSSSSATTDGGVTTGDADTGGSTGEPLMWFSTCGDPVCSGYTKPDGVEPCTAEQLEGNPCDAEGATCDPMSDCNALLVCATKDPKQNEGGCPISRAVFKTDIEYLAPADLEQYAADLHSLRLATYRYRAAPADAPSRLGIILEDNEQGIWVDAKNDRVDLYGYASLAVATLQLQQRQIAALQAEVERLSTQANMSPLCGP